MLNKMKERRKYKNKDKIMHRKRNNERRHEMDKAKIKVHEGDLRQNLVLSKTEERKRMHRSWKKIRHKIKLRKIESDEISH